MCTLSTTVSSTHNIINLIYDTMDAFDSEDFDVIDWINSNLKNVKEKDNHQRISTLIMKLQILAQVRFLKKFEKTSLRRSFISKFQFFIF